MRQGVVCVHQKQKRKIAPPSSDTSFQGQGGCVVSLDNGRGRFLEAEIVIICASYTHLQPSFAETSGPRWTSLGSNLRVKESRSDTSRRCWDRPVERCFNLPSST
jgi:hypothetical protein